MENSIEEDIIKIEGLKYLTLQATIKGKFICAKVPEDYIQALEHILSDYKRVLKENEELKVELERQKDINTIINQKGIDKNYEKALEKSMLKFLKTNMAKDFVSVQKVKDIMKEKEWAIKSYDCDTADYKQSQDVGAWSALQKLLKKE